MLISFYSVLEDWESDMSQQKVKFHRAGVYEWENRRYAEQPRKSDEHVLGDPKGQGSMGGRNY